jgi:hypothetical protein
MKFLQWGVARMVEELEEPKLGGGLLEGKHLEPYCYKERMKW